MHLGKRSQQDALWEENSQWRKHDDGKTLSYVIKTTIFAVLSVLISDSDALPWQPVVTSAHRIKHMGNKHLHLCVKVTDLAV